ncbi:MAG: hypothetical protein IT374_20370 [Polyangiaceae bacterium]|nr:hypothetical protein [Polyangiaceae bacterium]
MTLSRPLTLALLASLLCLAGCGKKDEAKQEGASSAPGTTTAAATTRPAATTPTPSPAGESQAACQARCDKEKTPRDRLKCKASCPSGLPARPRARGRLARAEGALRGRGGFG